MVVCRDERAARQRFGVLSEEIGAVYTRSGRTFFTDADERGAVLDPTRRALETTGLFDELGTEWVLIDAEIMPWSAKAQS
jgi:protein phosphatase